MAEYKLLLPSMGEGVMEATIINWLVNEGDTINEDDAVVEIATDKVDSEVPSPVSGKIVKILKHKDDVAQINEVIAILEVEGAGNSMETAPANVQETVPAAEVMAEIEKPLQVASQAAFSGDLYLSPLVKSIAQQENISESELKTIKGSGLEGRITKEDILSYLKNRGSAPQPVAAQPAVKAPAAVSTPAPVQTITPGVGDEVIPMDRECEKLSQKTW